MTDALTGITYHIRISTKQNFSTGAQIISNPLSMQPLTQPHGLL